MKPVTQWKELHSKFILLSEKRKEILISFYIVGRVGKPEDIASMVMYLCSDKVGFITGENICIDGGMTRQMIYHGEHGWTFEE